MTEKRKRDWSGKEPFPAGSRAPQGNKKMNKPAIGFFFMEQRHSY